MQVMWSINISIKKYMAYLKEQVDDFNEGTKFAKTIV